MGKPGRWVDRAARLLAAGLLACAAGLAAADNGPTEVTQMKLERTEEGVLLSANVSFELPTAVDDALQKGIPMFFVADATLLRDRWYWYDKPVASAQRHMRLSFQPLTRRWRLLVSHVAIGNSAQALGQTFDTREEALSAVQRVANWRIAAAADVDPEARYSVEFRFRLDTSQLPRPFQIGAVGQSDWTISASRNQRLGVEILR